MSQELRVLHVITKMVVCGGASQSVALMVGRQSGDGMTAGLACGSPADEEELEVPPTVAYYRVPDLVRPVSPGHDLRALRQLRAVIRQFRPHIVHTHSSKAGVLGRYAARAERVPAVVHHVRAWSFHEEEGRLRRMLYLGVERHVARRCDALLFVARADLEMAEQLAIGRAGKRHVVRSGVDAGLFPRVTSDARARAREALDVAPDRLAVGTVAQLRSQKAPLDFAQVAGRVAREAPDTQFVWIGDGPMRAEVEQEVRSLGLESSFVFAGSRMDVGALYPALDVFLLTSLWEGLPRTVVEASMVGIPVVATEIPGTREIIRHRHNGMLAAPGDAEGLAGCVLELFRDGALRERLRGNAWESCDEFSIDKTVADLEMIYRELLSR